MKTLATLLLFLIPIFSYGQNIDFPDPNFKAALLEDGVDNDGDGQISIQEAEVHEFLNIDIKGIQDLTGISYFKALRILNCYGNDLTALTITDLPELRSIDVEANELESLELSGLPRLGSLNCSVNSLTELTLENFSNLNKIECQENKLQTLNLVDLTSLTIIDCRDNLLSDLDLSSANNLVEIVCTSNMLTTLDVNPITSLQYLDCAYNNISELVVRDLPYLQFLRCNNNDLLKLSLQNLPNLIQISTNGPIEELSLTELSNLEKLSLNGHNIPSLELTGFPSLTEISCGSLNMNQLNIHDLPQLKQIKSTYSDLSLLSLTNLPELDLIIFDFCNLPSLDIHDLPKLSYMDFSSNEIENLSLYNLPSLETLDLAENNLSAANFDNLSALTDLNLSNNNLSSLSVKDLVNLTDLNCSFNTIEQLDLSNLTALTGFSCRSNKLTNLPIEELLLLYSLDISNNKFKELNLERLHNLNLFTCRDNMDLKVLNIKTGSDFFYSFLEGSDALKFICVNDFEIERYLELIEELDLDCHTNSYCSFDPGGNVFEINGQTKFVSDNLTCDNTGFVLPVVKIDISDGTASTIISSAINGNYAVLVNEGNYTLTPSFENEDQFQITPSSISVSFPDDTSPVIQDFCVQAINPFTDVEVFIIPLDIARPGFDASYKIIYSNKGSEIVSGKIELKFLDEFLDFLQAEPAQEAISGNIISWSYSDLLPFDSRSIIIDFNLNSPMENPPLNDGDLLSFKATISPMDIDITRADNLACLEQEVVNSFDPNDKTCLDGKYITPEMVGEYVHYLIRFENTGTAEAINIVVKDSIDLSTFNIRSLQIIDSSHDPVMRIRDGNVVEFIFENILLPFEDDSNDGYVAFKIKTLPDLVIGDVLENTAEIFFDFNFPIVTNTAKTTVDLQSGVGEVGNILELQLMPNPISDVLMISAQENIKQIAIYNVRGQLIKRIAFTGDRTEQQLDVSTLKEGEYFVRIVGEEGVGVSRFVKM